VHLDQKIDKILLGGGRGIDHLGSSISELVGKSKVKTMDKMLTDQEFILSKIKFLIKNSEEYLWPKNKRPEEVMKMARNYCTLSILNLVYSLMLNITSLLIGPTILGCLDFYSYRSLITFLSFFVMAQISVMGTTWCVPLFVANCFNQNECMTELKESAIKCIRLNRRDSINLFNAKSSDSIDSTKLVKTLNLRLLIIILEYRIFITQLRPLKESFSILARGGIAAILMIFIIIRIHMSYLKVLTVAGPFFALTVIIFFDILVGPLSIGNKRGKEFLRTLSSLAAQVIHIQDESKVYPNFEHGIYYDVIVSLLQRELDDPSEIIRKFSTRFYGSSYVTLPNLVQIHYWSSLILVSTFLEIESWQKLVGDRLRDPLRIFY